VKLFNKALRLTAYSLWAFPVHRRILGVRQFLRCLEKPGDTVGQPQSAEMCVSHMPSLKAKKLGKLMQEKVLLEQQFPERGKPQ
jgi:hypothetical protein